MKISSFINTLRLLLCTLAMLASAQASAVAQYNVALDTATFSGSGWLYLQFNPGMDGGQVASTATLSAASGAFGPSQSAQRSGDVTGFLPGSVVFRNTQFQNYLNQPLLFGRVYTFLLSFSDSFLTTIGNVGSAFSFSLSTDIDGVNPLGNPDPFTASNLTFDLTPASGGADGTVAMSYRDAALLTVSPVIQAAPIPEPTPLLLLLAGLVGLILVQRARRTG